MTSKYPNQENILYGIVVGGDSEDPAPDKAGGFRVRIPTLHSPNVMDEDLPFVRMMSAGTQDGVSSFNPPPERGTAVMVMRTAGHAATGHMIVIGVLPNDIMKG